MKTRSGHPFETFRRAALKLTAAGLLASPGALLAQAPSPWTPLTNRAPVGIQMLLLLSDGTVMAQQAPPGSTYSNAWYRLTPDIRGSYVNGKWAQVASMNQQRLFYSSVVLPDGRVFVAGGEYGSNGTRTNVTPNDTYLASAEIYDPLTNIWTPLPPVPTSWKTAGGNPFAFGDSVATLLPNGNVLIGPVFGNGSDRCAIYDVPNNAWIDGPQYVGGANQNESSWLKLPDGSILTIPAGSTATQRFLPATNQWVGDGNLAAPLFDTLGIEIGSAHLLPSGKGFFIGANGNTGIYSPSGNTTSGSWTAGPALPSVTQNLLDNNGNPTSTKNTTGAAPDASAAMMTNGRILVALSGALYNDPRAGTTPPGATNTYWQNAKNPLFPTPTSFFEYDPVGNAFSPVGGPAGATDPIMCFQAIMLDLPDGSVLYSNYGRQLYVYRSPSGPPLPAGKPVIQAITTNSDGTYHLTGTGLNGISCGATFGDDAQMDTNYPLVRLTAGNGDVTYARTFNWSSTGVATGSTPVSTEFTLPDAVYKGGGATYSLVVVANGIASDPVSFSGPVWVDFKSIGSSEAGTFAFPYKTLAGGVAAVATGGTIAIKGPSSSPVTPTISKPLTIISIGGPSTIGQ